MDISSDLIRKSYTENKAVVFNSVFPNDYTWETFINHIDASIIVPPASPKQGCREVIGSVNFWQSLTMTIENMSDLSFPELNDKAMFIQSMHGGHNSGQFAAISFTTHEPTTGKHSDPVDVFYWQCVGDVKWTLSYENKEESFVLNPGDVIYVPTGIIHEVKSLTPRASISFMFLRE